ncbi:TldD/PmbA family protein [Methanopyrus sp.]
MDSDVLLRHAEEVSDACVVYALEGELVEIEASNGELRKADSDRVRTYAVRVLKGGSWGVASGPDPERHLIERALRSTGEGSVRIPEDVPAAEGSHRWEGKLSPLDSLDDAAELSVELSREVPYDCEITCSAGSVRYTITSTWGSECEARLDRVNFWVKVSGKGTAGREEYTERDGANCASIELFLERAEEVRDEAVRRLEDLLEAEPGPERAESVITDPELFGVIVHEAFGHAVEGDLVARGESVLQDRVGERVASEIVTVVDDPTERGAFGSYPFDDEGVEPRRTVLVEEGVLRGYLTDLTSAAELDLEITGNGRLESIGDHVQVRMSVTYVEPGDASREELFEEAGDGAVYLLGSRGGQTDTATGNFQFSAKLGYVVEDGEPSRPVRDVGLTGETLEFMKRVRILSDELRLHPGYCGKGGQLVPVSDGGPHALVDGPFHLRSG